MEAPKTYSLEWMSRQLGIGRVWAQAHIGVRFEPDKNKRYSEECWRHLQREQAIFMKYPQLGRLRTLGQAAEELTCSRDHLLKLIDLHRLGPLTTYRAPSNRLVKGVSTATFSVLKRLMLPYAPDGLVTIGSLHLETGWSNETAVLRLLDVDIRPVSYRCAANGHVTDHYPRLAAVAVLGYKPLDVPRAGSYLTANAIDRRLGRAWGWSVRRLADERNNGTSRMMLDDSGAMRSHYPPSVYVRLKLESDRLRLKKAA